MCMYMYIQCTCDSIRYICKLHLYVHVYMVYQGYSYMYMYIVYQGYSYVYMFTWSIKVIDTYICIHGLSML